MNKIYQSVFLLFSVLLFSQKTISFESNEGFVEGDINGQDSWVTTKTGSNPPFMPGQVISAEDSSDKLRSLKITKSTVFSSMPSPAVGAIYKMGVPLNIKNFNLSFDVKFTEQTNSSSEFGFDLLDEIYEGFLYSLSSIYFDNSGKIKIQYFQQNGENWYISNLIWLPNKWYRIRMEGLDGVINYYLDNVLLYTRDISSYNSKTINRLWLVHDNKSGSAFIDNIKINNEQLSINDINSKSDKITVFPNPTTDYLNIQFTDKIRNVQIFDISGKKVQVNLEGDKVDVRKLSAGSYLINVEIEGGNFTEKFIKK